MGKLAPKWDDHLQPSNYTEAIHESSISVGSNLHLSPAVVFISSPFRLIAARLHALLISQRHGCGRGKGTLGPRLTNTTHDTKTNTKNMVESRENEKNIGDYRIGRTIGTGGYANVKLGVHKTTGQKVALKLMSHDQLDSERLSLIKKEISIHSKIDHPHIVKVLDVIESESLTCLVLEYVEGKDLLDTLDDYPDAKAARIITQIASAIKYMHENGFVHRDIKLENIVVSKDGTCKLIDFGMAAEWNEKKALKTPCGSIFYAAPELMLGREYLGPKTDVWALGVLLYCMLTGSIPWAGDDNNQQIEHVLRGQWTPIHGASISMTSLLGGCLTVEEDTRLGILDVLEHEWLSSHRELKSPSRRKVVKRNYSGTVKDLVKKILN
ncbi:hypothetical protein PROFUN_02145 [Planoprotostelium fungivorum]|uniref:non-specific serine/threonine protein kinase n=1 Tax=Planoprotostelium fungivorum TaxID=1890364 RepID=A0A2P6NZ90_9EUKA|nr:hypothetical protein PROFUN_02145 [Planoprotostelium fungivorum]